MFKLYAKMWHVLHWVLKYKTAPETLTEHFVRHSCLCMCWLMSKESHKFNHNVQNPEGGSGWERRHIKHPTRSETGIRSDGPFLPFSEAGGAWVTGTPAGSAVITESSGVRTHAGRLAAPPGDLLLVSYQCAVLSLPVDFLTETSTCQKLIWANRVSFEGLGCIFWIENRVYSSSCFPMEMFGLIECRMLFLICAVCCPQPTGARRSSRSASSTQTRSP